MARYGSYRTLAYASETPLNPMLDYSNPTSRRVARRQLKQRQNQNRNRNQNQNRNQYQPQYQNQRTVYCKRCEQGNKVNKSGEYRNIPHSSRCPNRFADKELSRADRNRAAKLHEAKVLKLKAAAQQRQRDESVNVYLTYYQQQPTQILGKDLSSIGYHPWEYQDSSQKFWGTGFKGWGIHTPEANISGDRAWGKNFTKFDWQAFEWAHFGTAGNLERSAQSLDPWRGELVDGMVWRQEPRAGRRQTICYYDAYNTAMFVEGRHGD